MQLNTKPVNTGPMASRESSRVCACCGGSGTVICKHGTNSVEVACPVCSGRKNDSRVGAGLVTK